MLDINKLTPTLARFWEALSAGHAMTRAELRRLCNDDMVTDESLNNVISDLRRHLPAGLLIVCHSNPRPARYQLVRRYTPGE